MPPTRPAGAPGDALADLPAPSSALPAPFIVHTALRMGLGVVVLVLAVGLIAVGARLDWGLAPMVVGPGLALLLPGAALLRRRRLRRLDEPGTAIALGTGWLSLAEVRIDLDDPATRIEIVPTAGLHAVVVHLPAGEIALATWLSRRRAAAVVAWLDGLRPGRPLMRTARAAHALDY